MLDRLPEIVPLGAVILDRDLELVATDPVAPGQDEVLVAVHEPRSLDAARAVLRTGQRQRYGPFPLADPPDNGDPGGWCEVAWQVLPAVVGDEPFVIGLVEDVTDRVRSQQELEWRREESRLLQRLSSLVGGSTGGPGGCDRAVTGGAGPAAGC